MTEILVSSDETQTVDAVLNQIAQLHQSKLWDVVQPVIKVEGRVSSIYNYPKVSYFKLSGSESSLTVKCPTKNCPAENQEVVVKGHPYFKPGMNPGGISVEIEGVPIGFAEKPHFKSQKSIEKKRFLKLNQLACSDHFGKMVVFGTKAGIKDTMSQIEEPYLGNLDSKEIRVSDKSEIIQCIKSGVSGHSSFAIARGGDDDSLLIWNDYEFIRDIVDIGLPFYVAIGHSHRILGISHYADESFGTPSVFGNALNQSFKISSRLSGLEAEVTDLSEKLIFAKNSLDMKDSQIKSLSASQQVINEEKGGDKTRPARFNTEWLIITILVIIILFLI